MRLLIFCILLTHAAAAQARCALVEVRGAAPGTQLLVGLYASAQGFPREEAASMGQRVTLGAPPHVVRFDGIDAPRVAVAIGVDRNGNGRLDTGLFGIPTEPVAFSSGARVGVTGPPSFDAAAFALNPAGCTRTVVTLR